MRTLSGALTTALGGPVQRPAWLVQIVMPSSTLRFSSYGTLSWGGFTWTAVDLDISSLRIGALEARGDLVFGNVDDAFGATFLNDSPSDRPVTIYGYDAGATAAADPVLLAEVVGGGASIGTREVRVSLRAIVAPAFGFNTLLPAGRTLVINGISFRLERRR
jgi:hypothetical protein